MFDIDLNLTELVGCAIVGTGVFVCAAFGVLFVCLKCFGVIDWHWLWVLAPLFPFVFALAVVSANSCWAWLIKQD